MKPPAAIVVMGVSGSGKTTVGERLAAALGATLVEGDRYHPPANITKMSAGVPLTDADRWPWLDAIAAAIAQWLVEGRIAVVTCSALKRAYRDRLRAAGPGVRFVHLAGSQALIAERLAARRGHFMPPGLLASQFAALEPPGPDEGVLTVGIDQEPDAIVAEVLAGLDP